MIASAVRAVDKVHLTISLVAGNPQVGFDLGRDTVSRLLFELWNPAELSQSC